MNNNRGGKVRHADLCDGKWDRLFVSINVPVSALARAMSRCDLQPIYSQPSTLPDSVEDDGWTEFPGELEGFIAHDRKMR